MSSASAKAPPSARRAPRKTSLREAPAARADEIARTLEHAFISPVLTAHPTEVQRKSILDAEHAVAGLLAARDALATDAERADNEALLRARITQLWQTRMLRYTKLSVADEIENALSYYQTKIGKAHV